MERGGELVCEALSCGYTGFILLDALLGHCHSSATPNLRTSVADDQGSGQPQYTPRIYARRAPTYFGMLVASFLPSVTTS